MNANVSKLLHEQINKEFYSAYLYLDFANYYAEMCIRDRRGRTGGGGMAFQCGAGVGGAQPRLSCGHTHGRCV